MKYFILLIASGALILLTTILRTHVTYSQKLTAFFSNGNIKVISPCIIFTNIICLVFMLLFSFTLPSIQQSIDRIQCSQKYMNEITRDGKGEWGGLSYIISSI